MHEKVNVYKVTGLQMRYRKPSGHGKVCNKQAVKQLSQANL